MPKPTLVRRPAIADDHERRRPGSPRRGSGRSQPERDSRPSSAGTVRRASPEALAADDQVDDDERRRSRRPRANRGWRRIAHMKKTVAGSWSASEELAGLARVGAGTLAGASGSGLGVRLFTGGAAIPGRLDPRSTRGPSDAAGCRPSLHWPRWTSMSSRRSPHPPSGRRSTPSCRRSSGRRERLARRRPRPATDGHVARGGHEARSRRDLLLPALHAVQSRIGWISQPALAYICRRLTVPPAEAYGVATFYALFATTPRPPVVAHVCDDIACRLAGAEELCGTSSGRSGRPASRPRRRRDLAPQPLPRAVRASARGAVHDRRRDAADVRRGADRRGRRRSAGSRTRRAPGREPPPALRRPAGRDPDVGPAGRRRRPPAPRPGRPGRPDQPRRLPRARRLRGARPRARARPGAGDRGGDRVQARRSRRRGVPDRPQVGRRRRRSPPGRTTSSATPTNRSPARSRIGPCSRRTRSRSSRR